MDRGDLVRLRRARDQMDRGHAHPLDVEALARSACMSSGWDRPSPPDVDVVLEPPAADPGISPSDREAISDPLATGVMRGVNLSTSDVDRLFDRVQATGAGVVREPMGQSYSRDCAFRDPAESMIRIIQSRG